MTRPRSVRYSHIHRARRAIFIRRKKEYRTFAAQLLTAALADERVRVRSRTPVPMPNIYPAGLMPRLDSTRLPPETPRRLLKMPGGTLSIFPADERLVHATPRQATRANGPELAETRPVDVALRTVITRLALRNALYMT